MVSSLTCLGYSFLIANASLSRPGVGPFAHILFQAEGYILPQDGTEFVLNTAPDIVLSMEEELWMENAGRTDYRRSNTSLTAAQSAIR